MTFWISALVLLLTVMQFAPGVIDRVAPVASERAYFVVGK